MFFVMWLFYLGWVVFRGRSCGVGCCLRGVRSIFSGVNDDASNLARTRTGLHLRGCKGGGLGRNGGGAMLHEVLRRLSSPVVVVLVITTIISTVAR